MPFTFDLPSRSKVTTPRDPKTPRGVDDPNAGLMSKDYLDWFAELTIFVAAVPDRIALPVSVTNQSAAIAATPIPIASITDGLYRVSTYMRITTPATTSSSLTVSIQFPDDSNNCTLSGVALTGNTVTTVQSNTFLVRADAAGPIQYATAYASVGATAMVYALYVTVESVASL